MGMIEVGGIAFAEVRVAAEACEDCHAPTLVPV